MFSDMLGRGVMKEYYDALTDAWKFLRRYAEQMPLNGEAWAAEVAEKAALVDRHAGCRRFAVKLMTLVEDELEQIQRTREGR